MVMVYLAPGCIVRLLNATFDPVNGPTVREEILKVPSLVLVALFTITAAVAATLLELGLAGKLTATVPAVPEEVIAPEFNATVALGYDFPKVAPVIAVML